MTLPQSNQRCENPPNNWWTHHTKHCNTKYRGCSRDCPKDIYEKTGEWSPKKGAKDE